MFNDAFPLEWMRRRIQQASIGTGKFFTIDEGEKPGEFNDRVAIKALRPQMIYEVYEKFTEGLEQDRLAIFVTTAGTSIHRAKEKPRPHAKVPAKAGAFSPQPPKVVIFFGAGNGIRTRDLQLGKLTLYH